MLCLLAQAELKDFSNLTLGGVLVAMLAVFLWRGIPWLAKQWEEIKASRREEMLTLTDLFKKEIAAERSTGIEQLMAERVAREKSEERMTAAIDRNTQAIRENTEATKALQEAVKNTRPHSLD